MSSENSCLIVGAGITGLSAARTLQAKGYHIALLDKGRGIGGRTATRRLEHEAVGTGHFDYGAQYVPVFDPVFKAAVNEWQAAGIVTPWDIRGTSHDADYYRGTQSMRSIAKYLGRDMEVHQQAKVTHINWENGQWSAMAEDKTFAGYRHLILTAPVPQSLALLKGTGVSLSDDQRERLEQVQYSKCLVLMVLLKGDSLIPEPGGLLINQPPLKWIACNRIKGVSPDVTAVTIHATHSFSEKYWDAEEEVIAGQLLPIASEWLGAEVLGYSKHRWGYNQPLSGFGEAFAEIKGKGSLYIAGDAFASDEALSSGRHLENAYLSGKAVAEFITS